MSTADKILTMEVLAEKLAKLRAAGKVTLHNHGIYDLLHIGHIKHLQAAREHGDLLAVTLVPDRFVSMGPFRPAFNETLRAQALAALSCVDYVAISPWPTTEETIRHLSPSVYVTGTLREGKQESIDRLAAYRTAVESGNGRLLLTDEQAFSTTALVNQHMDLLTAEAKSFLQRFREQFTPENIRAALSAIKDMRILVVGETIIDEYNFCAVMAKSNKDPILAAEHLHSESYAGGVLAIANHLSTFCGDVGLLSALGEVDSREDLIRKNLDDTICTHFIRKAASPNIIKRRFVEQYLSRKLFEVYNVRDENLSPSEHDSFCNALEECVEDYDLVIAADYGHGLLNDRAIEILCTRARFLAVNTQTNAGNRGFNFISKYRRADYVSIDETEARLEARAERSEIQDIARSIAARMECPDYMITRGKYGSLLYRPEEGFSTVPAFAVKMVDSIGAGDALLALTAPCIALKLDPELVGFVGNIAGAVACGTIGNKRALNEDAFYRYIESLLR